MKGFQATGQSHENEHVGVHKLIANKRILITGGAGFIGTSIALRLAPTNELIIFDNLHRDAFSDSPLKDHPNVRLVVGDVMDREALERASKDVNVIIHLAAIAGVDTVMKNPVQTMKVAMIGTQNALDVAQGLSDLDCFIDFSTSEVFGSFAYRVGESDVTQLGAVGEARWTYAVSKLAMEHLALNYHKQYGLPTVAIRPFNIYGPRQVGTGAVHHFIVRALRGEPLTIHNDGSQIRAWCYIDDIVDGVMLTLTSPEAIGHTFNIGNPRSTVTIHGLAKEIVRIAKSTSTLEHIEWNFADVELRIPDIAKARTLLNYEPKVELEEGLARTIDWYRKQH
jgi:nucleoside-diphosphate-sugar epimerase